MTGSAAILNLPTSERPLSERRILVVSEDPFFIEHVRELVEFEGGRVIACLGPAASPCILDRKAVCPLAATSSVVIVDSPPAGAFRYHLTGIAAGDYAARLQRAQADSYVILIAHPGSLIGPTGDVTVVGDRDQGTHLLTWVMHTLANKHPSEPEARPGLANPRSMPPAIHHGRRES